MVAEPNPVTRYAVHGENRPGGAGTIASRTSTIAFDGSGDTGVELPGPADLLAAALAACMLKNVERFGGILHFDWEHASVEVHSERQDSPPKITRITYRLEVTTNEPPQRVDLLHRNLTRHGTIYNTLAAACDVSGEVIAIPTTS